MYKPKWHIGIDLYRNKIQLVAVKQRRKHWSLCECWQHCLPFELTYQSEQEQYSILLDIFNRWRQKLPKNSAVSIALPFMRTLKQQISLPKQVNLAQPELGWFLQKHAENAFPLHAQEMAIDYRVINHQAYLTGAHQSDIHFWQNLMQESGFNLLAIDVAPIALRYVARQSGLPDECWLVHYRQNEWLWSGPVSLTANYNHLQSNEITHLAQLIPLLCDDEKPLTLPIYCITDHPNVLSSSTDVTLHQWDLRQAFAYQNLAIPHQLGDYVIAAGLALRHGDIS